MLAPAQFPGGVLCPPETFRANVKTNLARGLPEIAFREPREDHLYIACAGPSLRDTAEELRGKAHIWALNGAHDYLISRGIVPSAGVAQAPEDGVLNYFQKVQPGTVYAFASITNPALVDRVLAAGGQVGFWHCHCPAEWGVDYGETPNGNLICGGGTIGLRALDLAYACGYREVHVLGFDACCSPDLRIGPDLVIYEDRVKDIRPYWINGRMFPALPSHARQVEDLHITLKPLTGLNITWYGDGLMQWAARGMNTDEV